MNNETGPGVLVIYFFEVLLLLGFVTYPNSLCYRYALRSPRAYLYHASFLQM